MPSLRARLSIDRLVEKWRGRIDVVARNLTDFNDSEDWRYVRARIRSHPNASARPFIGRTAETAQAIEIAFDGLWKDYLLVQSVVDEAASKAAKSSLLSNREGEVRWLLEQASIRLPSAPTPVKRRDLLDDPEIDERVTPAQAFVAMRKAFQLARDGVNAITETATKIEPRIVALRAEIDALGARAAAADAPAQAVDGFDFPSVDDIALDPLGSWDRLAAIEQALTSLEADVRKAERQIEAVRRKMPEAERTLSELRDIAFEAIALMRLSAQRVAETAAPDVELQAKLDELGSWLGVIRATLAEGRWRAAGVGFAKWEQACAQLRGACDEARRRAQKSLVELEDLAGRFTALQAKAEKLKAEKLKAAAGNFPLRAIEQAARNEIGQAPCRLAQARKLVEAYERGLHDWRRQT